MSLNNSLTTNDIREKLYRMVTSDSGSSKYTEGALSSTLIDSFAAITDLINFYVESTKSELNINTAQQYRSMLKIANLLGYSVSRPTPSKGMCTISVAIPENLTENIHIVIPKYTDFSLNGTKLVSNEDVDITLVNGIDFMPGVNKTAIIKKDVTLLQGEVVNIEFSANSRRFINNTPMKYQKFHIDDYTFSSINPDTQDIFSISIGPTVELAKKYYICTKSFNDTTEEIVENNGIKHSVLLRTTAESLNKDKAGIELVFGSGLPGTEVGIKTITDKVFVRYFSTSGQNGILRGVNGSSISIIDSNSTIESGIFTLKITASSDFIGGTDIESIDSIRYAAPNNFQTAGRLVTKQDYESFLKNIQYPIDVKHAIVWGENEELNNTKYYTSNTNITYNSIRRLANIILYSIVGDLYITDKNGITTPNKDYFSFLLDGTTKYTYPYNTHIKLFSEDYTTDVIKKSLTPLLYRGINTSVSKKDASMSIGATKYVESILNTSGTSTYTYSFTLENTSIDKAKKNEYSFNDSNTFSTLKTLTHHVDDTILAVSLGGNSVSSYWQLIANELNDIFNSNSDMVFSFRFNIDSDSGYIRAIYDRIVSYNYMISSPEKTNEYNIITKLLNGVGYYTDISCTITFNSILSTYSFNKISIDIVPTNFISTISSLFFISDANSSILLSENVVVNRFVSFDSSYVNKQMKNISMLNTSTIYISPIITEYTLDVDVVVKSFSNNINIRKDISEAIYSYLKEISFSEKITHNDISKVLMNSKFDYIVSIKTTFTPKNINIKKPGYGTYFLESAFNSMIYPIFDIINTTAHKILFRDIVNSKITEYLNTYYVGANNDVEVIQNSVSVYEKTVKTIDYKRSKGINEKTFVHEFIKSIIDSCKTNTIVDNELNLITESVEFYQVIGDIHADFFDVIASNTITDEGISEFSSMSEIPLITVNTNVYTR